MDLTKGNILVTGGSGFLGHAVLRALEARGADHVFAPRSAQYDLRDADAVRQMLQDIRPRVAIHLAASVGGIGANRDNPGLFFYDNAAMGVHLIEQCRAQDVEKLVIIGTICAYPKFTPVPFSEDSLWDGYPEETNAPYGLAKKMLLVQAQSYRHQYGLNAIYLMPANLFGPGDNFDPSSSHVIPALIRRMIEARDTGQDKVEIWGTGKATREFLYVDDAADGILQATERYDGAEPVNLGNGREISIAELASKVKEATGYEGQLVYDPSKPDGQPRRVLDISRAKKEFGFTASTSFEAGLAATVDWYERRRSVL